MPTIHHRGTAPLRQRLHHRSFDGDRRALRAVGVYGAQLRWRKGVGDAAAPWMPWWSPSGPVVDAMVVTGWWMTWLEVGRIPKVIGFDGFRYFDGVIFWLAREMFF